MNFSFPAKKPARSAPGIASPLAFLGLTALAVALLFTGCARHDHGAALVVPAHKDASETVKKAAPLAAANVDDDLQPSEGDITIASEIKALERSGKWNGKDKEPPATEKMLDMSKYDFPVVLNNQVAAYLELFQGEQREMFERWLARSTKYLSIIKRELAKAGLPQDLAYLSMIESGYTPTARSSAGAVGLWQFMPDTGKQYTLRIDNYIDERRHIEKSTKAAVNMLGELYKDFGDWYLAVAAYNSGPGRVQNGLSRSDATTFWELADEEYLPLETKRYVPKLIAAIIIAKDPKKYGFDDISYQPELSYDRLTVSPGLPLDAVALVAGCSAETIKSLNPELHRNIIPPNAGRYAVRIPTGSKELASRNLALLHTVHDTKYQRHVVKRREDMTTVCKRYGISRTALLKANNLHTARLTPGRTLLIPYTVTSYALGGKKATGIDDADMLAAMDSQVDNPVNTQVNAGTKMASLKAGKTKELIDALKPVKIARTTANGSHQYDDADWYLVKNGETLWSIAQKHKVSMNQIKKWNNLKSNAIHAGLRLRVGEA